MNAFSTLSAAKAGVALLLYLLLLTALLPLLPLRLLWRSRKAPDYRKRMAERFGFSLPSPRAGGIWVHAVSVGETFASVSTVKALLARHPERAITVTSTTPTGSAQVRSIFGADVAHCYAPYDWPLFVWLFLRRVRPDMLVVMETEIWPITLLLCHALGIDVVLANARMSEKSAAGYQKVRWLIAACLGRTIVAAQHEHDAQRLQALGASADKLHVTGSVKFDVEVDRELRDKAEVIKHAFDPRQLAAPVWIAASTHAGEEAAALSAHKQLLLHYPHARLLLAPRHPERFASVEQDALAMGMTLAKRSDAASAEQSVAAYSQVFLIDTLGELMTFFGTADLAFVGGSLVPVGGHNYLEPASWGLPVLSGPHRHNFLNIAQQLVGVGAMQIVDDADALAEAVEALCNDSELRAQRGAAGTQLLESNRGASARLLALLENCLLGDKQTA